MSNDAGHQSTVPVGDHRSRRWWCDIRWITAGVIVGTVVFLLWGLFGPEAAIRVSRETTYLTEPLAADGLPDYRAALLAMAGPAPPPEENAAAALLQVCWPLGIDDADLPKVCAALGIPNEPPADRLRAPDDDAASKVTHEMYFAAGERPWTGADLPELEAWLVKNEATITQLVTASKRPRYWLPEPSMFRAAESMFGSWTFVDVESRHASTILTCRAMWHIGERRYADAWRDIHAIYRFARLVGDAKRGPTTLITELMTVRIEATASDTLTEHLLAQSDLPRDLLTEIIHDLDGLGTPSAASNAVMTQRLEVIDTLVFVARRAAGGRAGRSLLVEGWGSPSLGMLLRVSLDWNRVLKEMNDDFDRIHAAWELPTYADRRVRMRQIANDAESEFMVSIQGSQLAMGLLSCGRRSGIVAARLRARIIPSWVSILSTVTRRRALFDLSRTTVALAAWRADHAGDAPAVYPERLDDLVPQYLSAVPTDPFSDKPFIYERRGSGYLLASVGENGVYDGGTDEDGDIVNGEWQAEKQDVSYDACDLVVRMPVPERPFVPSESP